VPPAQQVPVWLTFQRLPRAPFAALNLNFALPGGPGQPILG
jgi:hypothetical protein